MTTVANAELAHDFYSALGRADAARLLELVHDDFTGHLSEGLPDGFGGMHVGARTMLREVWAPIADRFGVRPVPDRMLLCESGEILALGHYVAEPPRSLHAAFAHMLTFRDGRLAELRQVTDTQRWHEAASRARVAVVERMFAAVEARDAETLLSTYARDIVIREASSLPHGGIYQGYQGALEHARAYLATWDPMQTEADRRLDPVIHDAGDCVFVRWHQRATARDGGRLDVEVIDVVDLRGGKVVLLQMFPLDTASILSFLEANANLGTDLG